MNIGDRVYYTGNNDSGDLGTVIETDATGACVRWDRNNPDACMCTEHYSGSKPEDCAGEWFRQKDLTVAS